MIIDTHNLRYLPRRSSKNCDLQFANSDRQTDRFKENCTKPTRRRLRPHLDKSCSSYQGSSQAWNRQVAVDPDNAPGHKGPCRCHTNSSDRDCRLAGRILHLQSDVLRTSSSLTLQADAIVVMLRGSCVLVRSQPFIWKMMSS